MPEETVSRVTHAGDTVIVSLRGEVDVLSVDRVRVALSEALSGRPRLIEVDLADLSFIDSTGLGALVFGFQRARDLGVGFRLAHPTRGVHQVLVLSGLLEVVEVTP